MYYVDLKSGPGSKLIYNTKYLLNCRITFEVPRPKRQLPQCATCQRYGHTRRFCFRKPRCVKCTDEHSTANCPRKGRSDNVKCVLCNGNHPANYKGCSVYKDLQRIKYPTLSTRNLPGETTTPKKTQPSYATVAGQKIKPGEITQSQPICPEVEPKSQSSH